VVLLKLSKIEVRYGELQVLRNVSIELIEGEIVGILGPNGSGKTTLLRTISGFVHPSQGILQYRNEDVSSLPTYQLCRKGLSLVPEGRQLFGLLSVEENLRLGALSQHKQLKKEGIIRELEHIYSIFPRIKERCKHFARTLSGGEQQMLAIGRALMSKPALLLLDEPSHGLAPLMVKEVLQILRKLSREEHLTVILAEQDVRSTLSVADRAYVLHNGEIILEGPANKLAETNDIQTIYLGTSGDYRRH
jgi:branched-chain amino acid transport system ATP-binding protein